MPPETSSGELIIEEGPECLAPVRPAQDVVAMLLAAKRYTVPEIAKATGVRESNIYSLRESPLFMTLVREYERRFTLSSAEAKLMDPDDATKTVATLQSYRDGNFDEKSPVAAIRLRAAQTLFERQLPRSGGAAPMGNGSVRVNINVSHEKMDTMKQLVNYHTGDVIDVTADGPPPETE